MSPKQKITHRREIAKADAVVRGAERRMVAVANSDADHDTFMVAVAAWRGATAAAQWLRSVPEVES